MSKADHEQRMRERDVWSRHGRFTTTSDQPSVVCGVCCIELRSPVAKAEHLRHVHGAHIAIVIDRHGVEEYVWTRTT